MGPKAKAALPALRRLLARSDRDDRFAAAEALAAIDPREGEALSIVLGELLDRQGVQILGALLPTVRSAAVAALTGQLDGDEGMVLLRTWSAISREKYHASRRRVRAVEALGRFGGSPALFVLMCVARDEEEDPQVRAAAVCVLSEMQGGGLRQWHRFGFLVLPAGK
jgi:HEAT repeat protein